jgi:transposase
MLDAAVILPTTLDECHAQLREMMGVNAQQQATIDEQQTAISSLKRDLALIKRSLFGQRRERFDDPRQGLLFDAAEIGGLKSDADADKDDESAEVDALDENEQESSKRRRGRVRRVIPEGLPREKRVHELNDDDIPEHLQGDDVRRFLKKTGEWVEWQPPQLTVIEEYVETLAVDNADATQTTMISAERPARILNCFAGPSLLAGLAVNHFADHLPYYRLEEILGRSKLVIDRSTQCRWMIRLADELAPLVDLMRNLALQSAVVLGDETPVKMLVPGNGKTSTTYLWAVLGNRHFPYTTFSFTENRSRAGPAEIFANFEGILVSDAYIGYELLESNSQGRIRIAGCYAHARRKFEELHKLGPTKQTATAMGYFRRLFDLEDELRELSDDERHEQRQLRSRPVLEDFKRWMDEQLTTLRPKHELRGAIHYMTSRWECFERFLQSGEIPLDNNGSEQAVKNPVMGKKNWLFFGSPAGGKAAAVFYSLTATCRRLKIDPFAYLNDVFVRLPECDPEDSASLRPLLPDHWLAAHPESRLQTRVTESAKKAQGKRTARKRRRKAPARVSGKRR